MDRRGNASVIGWRQRRPFHPQYSTLYSASSGVMPTFCFDSPIQADIQHPSR